MSNLSMVLNKAFEDVNSDQWQKEYEEIYNMSWVIEEMRERDGFNKSLSPLLIQYYVREGKEEADDMLLAISVVAAYGHKDDVSKEDFEWLEQFKVRNGESYRWHALWLYKEYGMDKDVLSFAYRHSKTEEGFSALASNVQESVNNQKKEEQEA